MLCLRPQSWQKTIQGMAAQWQVRKSKGPRERMVGTCWQQSICQDWQQDHLQLSLPSLGERRMVLHKLWGLCEGSRGSQVHMPQAHVPMRQEREQGG